MINRSQGRFAAMVIAAFVTAFFVAACATTAPDDSALAALKGRADALRGAMTKDPDAATALRGDFDKLAADALAWRNRTGRDDIGADLVRGATAARADDGGGDPCAACKGFTLDLDRICILESDSGCDPEDDTFGRICVYRCIWIGAGARPTAAELARE